MEVCLVYLVHLVSLVSLVYLVYLVYLVCLVSKSTSADQRISGKQISTSEDQRQKTIFSSPLLVRWYPDTLPTDTLIR